MEEKDILEQMRSEMATLKQMLETQQIVNEKTLRSTVRRHVSSVSGKYWGIAAVGVVGILVMSPMIHFMVGAQIWMCLLTAAFFLWCTGQTIYAVKELEDALDESNNSLLECADKIIAHKQKEIRRKNINVVLAIVWAILFFADIYTQAVANLGPDAVRFTLSAIGGGCIGGCIGGFIGWRVFKRNQEQLQEAADQILEWKELR